MGCVIEPDSSLHGSLVFTHIVGTVLQQEYDMAYPAPMDIVRRAYELWQQAGEPEGRDWEFYLQAEKELRENDKDGVGPEPTVL
jgi:hypothetical protein